MLLTLTSTAERATDLGYLLHKHPDRVQTFDLPVGNAHVFYPEATDERCTVALLLEVDPIGLVRGRRFGGDGFALSQYVNDRPYAASSMLAVALGRVFKTALQGRCAARPDLEAQALPLVVHVPALPCGGDPDLIERLFAPLGWAVSTVTSPLDPELPGWGSSPYTDVTLTGDVVLSQALGHLYVLLPVLDGAKHYWVSNDEVDKLVRNAGGWLRDHPERDLVTRRYLAHQQRFVADATQRLAALEDTPDAVFVTDDGGTGPRPAPEPGLATSPEVTLPPPVAVPLRQRRQEAVLTALREVGARRVVDLGCGEGSLLAGMLADPSFAELLGVDVSPRELDRATRRLGLDRLSDSQRARLTLRRSSLTYRDAALAGFDAAVLMEVIEHLDPDRLPALETNVFAHARPGAVIVTTPNADHNAHYEGLAVGARRHADHRFEWGRAEFAEWAERVGRRFGYSFELRPVGDVHPELGPPTQLALFRRDSGVAVGAA
ncbi:3' terminal RNA ribose 2'-O-methyltransferase Hen1 [Humibacillus sp. DSM 29435]|uniref:3' terminal RNA ribose 2'-O-methyltransferase Hen1 n=1 Tax=Humibacillus sp. DSM 29435 TaxID=1869167 RepID=UPI00087250A1|nr:3' terminal RNA ribose 2'-O-methyltransferase Hen1 [Humibacillus sp. DSM 29435]OFE15645.1 3' terminal RNA ribose 2'-O-methyltransferase Hen1 [Humibacillus sp. DSM 29435]